MDYLPTSRFVLIEPKEIKKDNKETILESGIVIKSEALERKDSPVAEGVVLSVGPDVVNYKDGDKVLYNYFAGNSFIVKGAEATGKDDKEYHLVWEEDILAKGKK